MWAQLVVWGNVINSSMTYSWSHTATGLLNNCGLKKWKIFKIQYNWIFCQDAHIYYLYCLSAEPALSDTQKFHPKLVIRECRQLSDTQRGVVKSLSWTALQCLVAVNDSPIIADEESSWCRVHHDEVIMWNKDFKNLQAYSVGFLKAKNEKEML